jgi:UDP-3-O-[3-hydroxymyristoyl] N-acetylglucosamine deacetylase
VNGLETPQTTVARTARIEGIGLHTGAPVSLSLTPAPADTGIVFIRLDLPGQPCIAARPESVNAAALQRRTELLGPDGAQVLTPEHLLAACLGLGLDNARVELDGPEVPILDGSALPFVKLIEQAGLTTLNAERKIWHLRKPVSLILDHAEIHAAPAERMALTFFAPLDRAGMEGQSAQIELDPLAFAEQVAPARTFVFYEDVEKLRQAGLIRGGSLDCALVLKDGHPLETGYRLPNELAAHKLLDIIGDFAILGRPLAALVTARGSGHALHHQFIEQLRKELTES